MHAPERLGKYLIRRELGRGAMGVVYEGYDPMIERAVAIKVLRLDEADPHLAAELRMRFRREAQAAGRLGHPGIVGVYEYGEDAGADATFIAMELVRGRDLKSLFDSGKRFTLAETGRLMAELLAALQHAHERGVVHRDIKPGNIILLDDGGVKVADFGIARLDTSELTQLGSVLGTVSHMSPEQLTGEAVDGRSDLYSCGVILYQLLTGTRPFSGPPAALIHKVLHESPPPVSQRVPTLPRALDDVVHTAMAKRAAQRYVDAREFATALRAALDAALSPRFDADATLVPQPLADPDATLALPSDAAAGAAVSRASGARVDAVASSAPPTLAPGATPAAPIPVDANAAAAGPSTSRSRAGNGRSIAFAVLGVAGVVAAGAVVFRMLGSDADGAAGVAAPASAALSAALGSATASAPATTAMLSASVPAAASREMPASAPSPSGMAAAASAPTAKVAARPPATITASTASTPRGLAPTAAPTRIGTPSAVGTGSTARARETPATAPTVVATAPALTHPPAVVPAPTAAPVPSAGPSSSKESRVVAPPPAIAAPTRGDARIASAPSPRIASAPSGGIASAASARSAPAGSARVAAAASAPLRAASAAATARGDNECLEPARRGDARCQVVVGQLYRNGRGVARDPVEAARWFAKAAEQGSDAGQYELGLLHESGMGVPRDQVTALAWYRKAAAQGHARAQNKVGNAYENGTAAAANPVLAAEWYRKAADQNLPIAEYNLGRLYLSGRGVFKDTAKGQALLEKAADAGEPNAMVYVAVMYDKGDGKPRDRDRATRLYREALARTGMNDRNRETATRALAAPR